MKSRMWVTAFRMLNPLVRFAIVAGLLLCTERVACAQTAEDLLDNYVGPLKLHNIPIVYAECSYNGGKVMIIFPLGSRRGRFVELAWGAGGDRTNPALASGGDFTVTSKVDLENLMMGGPGAYLFQAEIIENLLEKPFEFVYPQDLDSIVQSEPKSTCHPSP